MSGAPQYEAYVDGHWLPLSAPVRRTLATPFPGKVTFGDYTRDNEVVRSSWITSSLTGGLGKRVGIFPQDQDRFDFGNLQTSFVRQLTLGSQVILRDTHGPIDVMQDYTYGPTQVLFYSTGTSLWRWDRTHDNGDNTFGARTKVGVPVNSIGVVTRSNGTSESMVVSGTPTVNATTVYVATATVSGADTGATCNIISLSVTRNAGPPTIVTIDPTVSGGQTVTNVFLDGMSVYFGLGSVTTANGNTYTFTVTNTGVHDLATSVQDACVYFGKLYFLSAAELVEYNAITDVWATYAVGGSCLIGWDDKLFRLNGAGQIFWTISAAGGVWTQAGQVPLPPGYVDQLITFVNLLGENEIFAVSKVGLFIYDFDSEKFIRTAMTFPFLRNNGKRADVWRGQIYIPSGTEEYQFNNQTVQPTGPNKDDGLPPLYHGDIARVLGGHAYRYAFVNGRYPDQQIPSGNFPTDPIFTGLYHADFDEGIFDPVSIAGAVLFTPGTSWHGLYIEPNIGPGWTAALAATIQGTTSLFFSNANGLYETNAPTALHNPLYRPDLPVQTTGYVDTPWFDSGFIEMDKLAISMNFHADNVTSARTIKLSVAWDNVDTWYPVTTITTPGFHSVSISGRTGRLFKTVRLRIEMVSDSTVQTPILREAVLTFTREPDRRWVYQLNVAIPEEHDMDTEADLRTLLEQIALTKHIIPVQYRTRLGEDLTKLTRVSNVQFTEEPGSDNRGMALLTLEEMS